MNYIINPMWFYWVGVLSKLSIISIVISVVLGLSFLAFIISSLEDYVEFGKEDKDFKTKIKLVKIIGILLTITLTILILIPSRQTIYTMMMAKLTTTDNMQIVKEESKELIEFFTEQIEDIIDNAEEE